MREVNGSRVKEFILLGFPGSCELRISLFMVFLLMYLLTIIGNVSIIVLVKNFQKLHTPMYFFLCNLSFLEIWYTSACIPKMLSILVAQNQAISFIGCLTQMYIVFSLGCTEYFLLAAMAYDRYLAICYPLHYNIIINCVFLTMASWLSGFLASIPSVVMISRLQFCHENTIGHFFCDISPLLKLSCTDTSTIEVLDFVAALVVLITSVVVTGTSYICIFCRVAKLPSRKDKSKAFSTCVSHLTVVSMFYATTIFMYARPKAIGTFDLNKPVSILYSVVVPFLNPIIYSLRNREVRKTLSIAIYQVITFSGCFLTKRLKSLSK
uniref:Olfactory receptor n=1 Tax=Naja naja TaxID=35670 RepID=A0A8C6XBK6_NAJNA